MSDYCQRVAANGGQLLKKLATGRWKVVFEGSDLPPCSLHAPKDLVRQCDKSATANYVPSRFGPMHHMRMFAGTWQGHGRDMHIDRHGAGKESISMGCCHRVIDLEFQLTYPKGTTRHATVSALVLSVRVHDRGYFAPPFPRAPEIFDEGTFRLDNGVISEPFTKMTYCNGTLAALRLAVPDRRHLRVCIMATRPNPI